MADVGACRGRGPHPHRRGLLDVPLPAVLGRDVCGVVDAAGDGVTGFAVGDEVIGPRSNGAYAQFVTTPTPFVGRKPAGMTRAQAATLGVAGLTAYRAVSGTAPIPSGAPVLVTGALHELGYSLQANRKTLRRRWLRMGSVAYPEAKRLLITADGGGSNGSRNRLWKVELQKFADADGLRISVVT